MQYKLSKILYKKLWQSDAKDNNTCRRPASTFTYYTT